MPVLAENPPSVSHRAAARAPVRNGAARRIALSVGGISFAVESCDSMDLALDRAFVPFLTDARSCDIEVKAGWAPSLSLPAGRPLFASGGLWNAYEENGGMAFYFRTEFLGDAPYKKAWFDKTFSTGRVWLLKRYFQTGAAVNPLEYPLDELLMIHKLSTGLGMEVHSCGVVTDDGRGRLFVGHSGAGKSTTSRLWMHRPGVCVLSDDRIILRQHGNEFRMYGTPWHGDAGLAAQASNRLDRIFLLEHASKNEIFPLEPARAAAELLARCFVPFHSGEGLANTMRLIESIVKKVPVSVFRFIPGSSAVEEILRAA